MKTISIITKGIREQVRSYWVLLLSLSMADFFIFIYYLIIETSQPQYHILIANSDAGYVLDEKSDNRGADLIGFIKDTFAMANTPAFIVEKVKDKTEGIDWLKSKKGDVLVVVPDDFSLRLGKTGINDTLAAPTIEFVGDITNTNYLISAVWCNEALNQFVMKTNLTKRLIEIKETALGISASIGSFDMMVPGILIVSLIMLMFTASIAFVSEVENKTIMRLKLSKLNTIEFVTGVGFVQLLVGLLSVVLTLLVAIGLGFNYTGSLFIMFLVASLTSLSIISFSLIIAALTKSATEVLVVGNFPMFLFMFFTGAAFPLKSGALFTIAGYPVNFQGLMTPTHAISALNKTFIMDMDFISIVPEITAILVLTLAYFVIGAAIFSRRHLKMI